MFYQYIRVYINLDFGKDRVCEFEIKIDKLYFCLKIEIFKQRIIFICISLNL